MPTWRLNRRCVWPKKIRIIRIMNKNSLSSSMVKRKKEKRETRMKKWTRIIELRTNTVTP